MTSLATAHLERLRIVNFSAESQPFCIETRGECDRHCMDDRLRQTSQIGCLSFACFNTKAIRLEAATFILRSPPAELKF
jgi:hypothetical protein